MLRLILGPVCVFFMLMTAATLAGRTVADPTPRRVVPVQSACPCGGNVAQEGPVIPPKPVTYSELTKAIRDLKGSVVVVDLWTDG